VLACGFGLVPNVELARRLGCAAAAAALRVDELQQTSVRGVFAAGELVGIGGVDQALVTGAIAGLAAAGRPVPLALLARRGAEAAFATRLGHAFALRAELSSLATEETLVCRCEDVTLGAIEAEAPAGARAVKLRTRAGMGACQGRVCGAALAHLRGFPPDSTRPPVVPAMLCTLACDPAAEDER
jgi:NAD(P)H-nitrite reductase large subunit